MLTSQYCSILGDLPDTFKSATLRRPFKQSKHIWWICGWIWVCPSLGMYWWLPFAQIKKVVISCVFGYMWRVRDQNRFYKAVKKKKDLQYQRVKHRPCCNTYSAVLVLHFYYFAVTYGFHILKKKVLLNNSFLFIVKGQCASQPPSFMRISKAKYFFPHFVLSGGGLKPLRFCFFLSSISH